ncbi:MAG TPA: UPF0175 family protein [Phycisphaerae bacterium]|nr:UPF0175 family protein [Phycisphaerae bacterium]
MTLTLNVPDDVLKRVSEQEMRVELACRLFDSQRLTKFEACELAGMSREEFDAALKVRNLPVMRYTEEMFREDMRHVGGGAGEQGMEARN